MKEASQSVSHDPFIGSGAALDSPLTRCLPKPKQQGSIREPSTTCPSKSVQLGEEPGIEKKRQTVAGVDIEGTAHAPTVRVCSHPGSPETRAGSVHLESQACGLCDIGLAARRSLYFTYSAQELEPE